MSLKSFGIDATPALSSPDGQSLKDTAVRAHFGLMRTRPAFNYDKTRMRYYESEDEENEDIREAEGEGKENA